MSTDPRLGDVVLEVQELTRVYDATSAVGPVSLAVRAGECFGLVGANGAGKTTLLRLILGLDTPTSGAVRVLGRPVEPFEPTPAVSGLVEEPRFFPWLDAADNLRAAFPHRDLDKGAVSDLLAYVGLGDVGRRKVRAFSQGMRQRLGIGRVLLAEPALMVLDEPTNGLDPVGIRWLRTLIEDQRAVGTAIVLSSHMLHEVQAASQSYLLVDQGRPVTSGSVADIVGVDGLESLYFSVVESD